MKNQIKIIIIKCICFVFIGVILFQVATSILTPKWVKAADNRMGKIMKGFYEEPKNSLDVIFMGNSDVYRGVSPITLWEEYGIASYNYVSSGQRMWTAYYMLMESLKYQKPKVIVLNMDSAFNETKSSESNYRKVFDNMKMSVNKIEAITAPVYKNKKKDILSYVFPIIRYHSRWAELEKEDFRYAFKKEAFAYKGMDVTTLVKPYTDGTAYMNRDNSKDEIKGNSLKYLQKIIKVCEENDITLVLLELPSADSWSKDRSEKTAEFAKLNNKEFFDMNLKLDEIGFDWTTDTADGGDHLNVYGAEKVSKFLGKVLQEQYNIPSRKEDERYIEWNEAARIYHEDIKKMEAKEN